MEEQSYIPPEVITLKIITVEKKKGCQNPLSYFSWYFKVIVSSQQMQLSCHIWLCLHQPTNSEQELDSAHLILSQGGPAPGTSEHNTRNPTIGRGAIILPKERFFC